MSQATCCWCTSPLVHVENVWWCGNPINESCRIRQARFATAHIDKKGKGRRWIYVPSPIQALWHEATLCRTTKHLGVGGAAGPGKSKWGREALFWFAKHVPGFHALLMRKTHKDLDQSHLRFMPHEAAQRGGEWKVSDRIAVFKHKGEPDSIIRAGHMENAGDIENYLSSEYDIIFPDELVTFERDPMLELFSRARTSNPHMFALRGWDPAIHGAIERTPTFLEADGRFTVDRLDGSLVMTATNPGGRGALWVRDFFVTKDVDRSEFPKYNPQRWVFYPAKLEDNPYMAAGYRETLENLPEMRRRQLLDGDWLAYEGQFFGEWRPEKDGQPWHVMDRPIATGTTWSCGMDWGWNSPGWVGWFAHLPDGHYHLGYEYKFQGQNAFEVASAIKRINTQLGIEHPVIAGDPSMWNKTGAGRGEAIAETLARPPRGLRMRKGDNDRRNGAMRMHEFLREAPDGRPWLTVSPLCKYFIRTIPALVQDKHDPEDVDTTGDDHPYDGAKYWAMSRPAPSRAPIEPPPPPGSWGWWRKHHEADQGTGVLA